MTNKDKSAFPRYTVDMYGTSEVVGGMSLRQYYIGQALAGIMANPNCVPTLQTHFNNIADDAGRVADAVLFLDNDK